MPFMSGVSAVIQNLYSSTDSTVAYFVHLLVYLKSKLHMLQKQGTLPVYKACRAQPWFTMITNMHVILCGERSQ